MTVPENYAERVDGSRAGSEAVPAERALSEGQEP